MGKLSDHQLPVVQPHGGGGDVSGGGSGILCCQRCGMGSRRIAQGFSFKCIFVVLLGFGAFVYGLFSVTHLHHSRHQYGFDVQDYIKRSATIQASFRLPKPVSEFSSQIPELGDEIFQEIGLPSTKVAVLSAHQEATSNWTDVVFGVLSNPLNESISPAYISLIRSTFLDIFQQQANLTLTNETFGQPSAFEILKFPGGMTLIPDQSHPVEGLSQIKFNFILNNSIAEIKTNSASLKTQLMSFLHLTSVETVSFQVSNKNGSTRDPPVTVEASVSSDGGAFLSPDRLRALAQTITRNSAENLGLDNTIFGKVKEVRLSSILNRSLDPSPSPSPSPSLSPSPAPDISPSPVYYFALAPTPESHHVYHFALAPTPESHHFDPCQDSDVSALSDDTHAVSLRSKRYGDSSLPHPPSASATLLMHDGSKDSVSSRGVTSSTSATPLLFSYIVGWWICLFGLFMADVLQRF